MTVIKRWKMVKCNIEIVYPKSKNYLLENRDNYGNRVENEVVEINKVDHFREIATNFGCKDDHL